MTSPWTQRSWAAIIALSLPAAAFGCGQRANGGSTSDNVRTTPAALTAESSAALSAALAPQSSAIPSARLAPAASASSSSASSFADSFAGNGPLLGYLTHNPSALPDVSRKDGRYHASLINNADDVTLHYHRAQGRLDAKRVRFPFEVIARNIGIGTQADSQRAPSPTREPYIFAGIQVHVAALDSPDSSHLVVGHRGPTAFTIEAKNTLAGHSQQNDAGAQIVPAGRADLRIVGHADHSLSAFWQLPNPAPGKQPDHWTRYNGDGKFPGEAPRYADSVYVGLITYAYGYNGVPFVGTCDALEGGQTN